MNATQLLKRPAGDVTVLVHLRRGSTEGMPTSKTKTLKSDPLTATAFIDAVKESSPAVFAAETGNDDETLLGVLASAFEKCFETFMMLNTLNALKIKINGNNVFIHPGDISHIELRTSGLFKGLESFNENK